MFQPHLNNGGLHAQLQRPLHERLVTCQHPIPQAEGEVQLPDCLAWVDFEVVPSEDSLPEKVALLP